MSSYLLDTTLATVSSAFYKSRSPSPTGLPEMTIQAIKDLDVYLAGKDESALKELFGTAEMFAANIGYQRDRIIHFRETGDKDFNWWPDYAKDGTLTLDRTVMGENLKKQGGGLKYDSDSNRVYGVIVPKRYSDGKKRLALYETSIGMPSSISVSIRGLREALEENEIVLIRVFDEAMLVDKRYFLLYDDGGSEFWHALDVMGEGRFIALEPKAVAIREAARKTLGVQ